MSDQMPEPVPLACDVHLDSEFLVDRLATVYLLWREKDGRQQYATLQWHDREPGKPIPEFTLEMDRKASVRFEGNLWEMLRNGNDMQRLSTALTSAEMKAQALEAENQMLRDNLSDLRIVIRRSEGG